MGSVEFPFVLDLLHPKKMAIKKMFGCTALYSGEKIMLIFRLKKTYSDDNGVWIATVPEHHDSLRKDFPIMRSIRLFGKGPTSWQNLPMEEAGFESAIEKVCDLIKRGDSRIGKVPDKKRKAVSRSGKSKRKARRS